MTTESPHGWTWASPDLAKSRTFYGGLFGWNCPEGPPEAGGYSVCDLGGKTVAGLGPQMNPDFPPAWMTYVNVDDADVTASRVAAMAARSSCPQWTSWTSVAWPSSLIRSAQSSVSGSPISTRGRNWPTSRAATAGASSSRPISTPRRPSTRRSWAGTPRTRALPRAGTTGYTEWKVGGRSVGGMMAKTPTCRRTCRRTGACISPWRTRTPRWPRRRSSAVPSSWGRWTSSRAFRGPGRRRRCGLQRPPAQVVGGTMEHRRLGRTGHESSVAVLGGAACWAASVEEAGAWLRLAMDRGVNHLDRAAVRRSGVRGRPATWPAAATSSSSQGRRCVPTLTGCGTSSTRRDACCTPRSWTCTRPTP